MIFATMFSVGAWAQQDTVKTVAVDTTKNVIVDTVKVTKVEPQPVQPPPAPAATPKDQAPPLRCGELGVRFFPMFTSLAFNTYNGGIVQGSATLSYGYGLMLGLNFSKNIGIMAEADYNQISQSYKDVNLDRQVHLNYLDIPIMLSINTDKTKPVNLNLVAGPQFGINVGSTMTTSSNGSVDNANAVLAVKQGDIGLAYGAGLEFALNKMHTIRFDLGFRGTYGFVNINGETTGNNTYNILVNATRKTYGGYAGLAFLF